MQVYKYFDIGTAKPCQEARRKVPHYLIDILEPNENFNAYEFKTKALECCREIVSRRKIPLIVGGTGLYLKTLMLGYDCAVMVSPEINEQIKLEIDKKGPCRVHEELEEIDPQTAENISCNDSLRIQRALGVYRQTGVPLSELYREGVPLENEFDLKFFLLQWDREALYKNVEKRIDSMISAGWVEEVEGLINRKISQNSRPFQSIGYPQISSYLRNETSWDQVVKEIKLETRRYVKRQVTWFKKMPSTIPIPVSSKDNPSMIKNNIFLKAPELIAFLVAFCFVFLTSFKAEAKISDLDQAVIEFKNNKFQKSNELLSKYIKTDISKDEKGRTLFLSGMVLNRLGKFIEASRRLKDSLKIPSSVEGYKRYELAESLFQLKQFDSAISQIEICLGENLLLGIFPEAVLLKTKALEKLGKKSEAVLFLSEAIKKISSRNMFAGFNNTLPKLLYKQGSLRESKKEFARAFNLYKDIYIRYPLSKEAVLAFVRMEGIKEAPDIFLPNIQYSERMRRLKILLRQARFADVVNEIETSKGSLDSMESYFYLASAYGRQSKRDEAAKVFQEILKKFPNQSRTQEALFGSARNLWNLDRNIEAEEIFRQAIHRNPNSRLGKRARFFLGKVLEADGKINEAVREYQVLGKKRGKFAQRGAWRIGWIRYISGKFPEAAKKFQSNAKSFPKGDLLEANLFWRAKAFEKAGDLLAANQVYREVSSRFPFTYYGSTASGKLKKTNLHNSQKAKKIKVIQPISIKADEVHGVATKPKLEKKSEIRLERVRELILLGLNKSAVFEIRNIEKGIRKTFSGTLWMADTYAQAGAYWESQRLLGLFARFKTKLREKELPQKFWRRFFPLVYKEDIHIQAKGLGLDPFIATSIIRQESMFDGSSISLVGARGLMQIMPDTGKRLYQLMEGEISEFAPDLLLDPKVNIRLGTKYLGELNSQYKGDWIKILSCYNAGPEAVANWVARFPEIKDPDEFVERIPFPETRNFVKRVLRNRLVYQSLYGSNIAT